MDPFTLALLGGAQVGAGLLSSNAASRAAGQQAQAAQMSGLLGLIGQQQAIQAQQQAQAQGAQAIGDYYGKGAAAYSPYSQFGGEATNRLATLMGLRPGVGSGSLMRQPTQAELQMDPGYAFREQQGAKALRQQMSAGGLGGSGTALKSALQFGQNMASQEYGNAYERFMRNRANQIGLLQGGVGTGLTAAGGTADLAGRAGLGLSGLYSGTGANIANTLAANPYGQAMENVGQARASGYMGGATALGQALQAPAQNYMLYSMMNKFAPASNAAPAAGYLSGAPQIASGWGTSPFGNPMI